MPAEVTCDMCGMMFAVFGSWTRYDCSRLKGPCYHHHYCSPRCEHRARNRYEATESRILGEAREKVQANGEAMWVTIFGDDSYSIESGRMPPVPIAPSTLIQVSPFETRVVRREHFY